MKETKKANKAIADAIGITTARRPKPRPLGDQWGLEENIENKTVFSAPVLDAGPAETETGASVSSPEAPPPNPFFWREISDEDVKAAIHGCFLESICNALAKNYRGTPPFPMILGHALILMAAALTHQGEEPEFLVDSSGNPAPLFNITPARLSRLHIKTGHGNVPNAYVLVVAPSGAGKGLGCIRLAESIGYTVMTDGSPEGIKDAAIENPHIVLEIQEFSDLLKGKGSLARFKKGLTELFNAGQFNDKFSKRTGAPERSAQWFYPSVYAAIQPEMLKTLGRQLDIAQGLFGRFLVFTLDESDMKFSFNPCNPDDEVDMNRLYMGLRAISEIKGAVEVPDPDYNIKFTEPILSEISETMRPLVLRYGNEYLPRIALMLAIPNEPAAISKTPLKLTSDHLKRAGIVLHRILAMAESALGSLTNLEGHARILEENLWKMVRHVARIEEKTGTAGVLLAQISRNSNGTGWNSATREDLLKELAIRGWIVMMKNGQKIESVEKGCRIVLNRSEIPAGIL